MWHVFDTLEIIMGPYATKEQAEADMNLHINELYLMDYHPNPYVDFIEEDEDSVISSVIKARHSHELFEVYLRKIDQNSSQIKMSKDRKEMRKQLRDVFDRSKK